MAEDIAQDIAGRNTARDAARNPTNIVVGVSDAPASQSALDWAAARAAADGAELILHCVVGGAVGAVGEDDMLARALDAAALLLDVESTRVRKTYPDLTLRVHVGSGDPAGELIEASETASLLVLGTDSADRGRKGRHGARVAAGAHCPVVVVPGADHLATASRSGVVVGLDGSEVSEHALRFAAGEAVRLSQPLMAVSAWMPVFVSGDFGMYPDTYTTDLQAMTQRLVDELVAPLALEYPSLLVRTRVEEGDPADVINDAAEAAVLTVVGTHGRSGFARFLLGSVSEDVLAHLKAPTVVVR